MDNRSDSLVGRTIDRRYTVAERLAGGGMATVYRATDTRLDRDVAFKVMHTHLAEDEQFRARFHREARSAAALSHPGIVSVFDQGEDAGVVYLAMEYIAGNTLRDLIRDQAPLTPRRALEVVEQILDALSAAHSAGLIHRDIKPENVLLREDDGRIKVADFGLARAGNTNQSSSAPMGTVAYLAPELMSRGVADTRADVYAVGVVLFELLTGRQPFTGDTAIHVAYQHVNEDFPTAASYAGPIPEQVDDLVLWSTAKDPDERPVDAAEFLAELRRVRAELTLQELDTRPRLLDGAGSAPADEQTSDGHSATRALPKAGGRRAAQRRQQLLGRPVNDDSPRRAARRPRRNLGTRILTAVLATALVAGLVTWYFLVGPGAFEKAPDVARIPVAEAQQKLATQGFRSSVREAYSEEVARGIVVSTDPAANGQIRRGATMTLVVSKGSEYVQVPAVAGQPLDQAKSALEAVELKVGATSEAFDEKIPAGSVITQSREAGKNAKRGESVDLQVSKGRQPVEVPNVTGKAKGEAVNALKAVGLDPTLVEVFSDSVPVGTVVSQDPAEGTVYRGDKIKVNVSKGTQNVVVPDVRSRPAADAAKAMQDAGLTTRVTILAPGGPGQVWSTNPPAGTTVPRGTTIELQIL